MSFLNVLKCVNVCTELQESNIVDVATSANDAMFHLPLCNPAIVFISADIHAILNTGNVDEYVCTVCVCM